MIDLATRRVHLAGITTKPNAAFIAQVARNLTDMGDGFLLRHRYLICDRDTKFTRQFRETLERTRVETVFCPRQAPNCNAYAERFVLSIKSECLNRMVFFGERALRNAIREYLAHYHVERAHQGIGNRRIESSQVGAGEVQRSERLGGVLNHYHRAA